MAPRKKAPKVTPLPTTSAPTVPGPEARMGTLSALSDDSNSWTPVQMLTEALVLGDLLSNAMLLEFETVEGSDQSRYRVRYAGTARVTEWLGVMEREKFDLLMSRLVG